MASDAPNFLNIFIFATIIVVVFKSLTYKLLLEPKRVENLSHDDHRTHEFIEFISLSSRPDLGIFVSNQSNLVNPSEKYAVIAAEKVEPGKTLAYAINLPVACAAWLQKGFGCVIITPYLIEKDHNANNLIESTLLKLIHINQTEEEIEKATLTRKGKIVHISVRVDDAIDLPQICQMSRIFVTKYLKYLTDEKSFRRLENVYLLTTDVDILPLTTELYHDMSFDFNLVNATLANRRTNGKLWVALSCVGGYVRAWDVLFEDNQTLYNSSGIQKLTNTITNKKAKWYSAFI